jgi:uncharacterized protein YlxW (UPF0749 family)
MSDMSQPLPSNHTTVVETPSQSGSWGAKAVLAAALAVVFGGSLYQSVHLSNELGTVKQQLSQSQQKMSELQTEVGATTADAKREANESLARMNEQLEKTRKEAQVGSYRAQISAKQQAGKVMKELSEKNTELSGQLDQIKQDNQAKSTEFDQTLTGIKGDVGDVKTEVATAKADIDNTKTDLRRAVGDMGVMSGLIATNSTELGELRKLGERNYIEFTLPRNGAPQKVGDIQMMLKKADVKRNRFTFDVLADDKRVEKRDKTINEPVQFYLSSMRLPYEVVVNSVTKDSVKGYLAVPKVKLMATR